MSRVPLVLLAFVYAGLMLYASLVPFQFQPLPADVWLQQLQSLLTSPVNIGSRSDFLANILLMLPFSFLSLGLFIHTTRSKAWWGVPLTLLLCISFSVLLEGLQLLFPPRHASLGDILAQTLGAILGIGLWLLAGVTLLKQYQQLQIPARTRHPLWYLFPLYLLLVVLETAPFDFTLSPVEIVHKYREGKITWVPLQNLFDPDRQLWLKSFWVMVKLLPVGLFLGLLPQLRGVQAVLLGLALATAIELLQLGVLSRYFEPTDILTGTLAVALGFRISTVLRSSPRGEPGTPGLVRSLLFLLRSHASGTVVAFPV
ncbi:MAG TPA: VanZ family protein [Gemmatales bacterium]|nr:VanZ family protein [Gemmatales bacterium]